ncbi:hypothetical protein BOX15_Mlig022331g1, partial [Macrostomum lignano]
QQPHLPRQLARAGLLASRLAGAAALLRLLQLAAEPLPSWLHSCLAPALICKLRRRLFRALSGLAPVCRTSESAGRLRLMPALLQPPPDEAVCDELEHDSCAAEQQDPPVVLFDEEGRLFPEDDDDGLGASVFGDGFSSSASEGDEVEDCEGGGGAELTEEPAWLELQEPNRMVRLQGPYRLCYGLSPTNQPLAAEDADADSPFCDASTPEPPRPRTSSCSAAAAAVVTECPASTDPAALEKLQRLEAELAALREQVARLVSAQESSAKQEPPQAPFRAPPPPPPPAPPPPPPPPPPTPLVIPRRGRNAGDGGAAAASPSGSKPPTMPAIDMGALLADIGKVRLRPTRQDKSPGGTPLKPRNRAQDPRRQERRQSPISGDPAAIIAAALQRKFKNVASPPPQATPTAAARQGGDKENGESFA